MASLTRLPEDDGGGAFEHLYTSAAVNPGVNGGRSWTWRVVLIGTVSTFMTPAPGQPFQFLGKVVPIDRIRAAFSDLEEAEEVFGQTVKPREGAGGGGAPESVPSRGARRAYPAVVSLDGGAEHAAVHASFPGRAATQLARARATSGPFSGILVDEEGWVVTSLRNLTNVASLIYRGWRAPAEAQVGTGLRAIEKIRCTSPAAATRRRRSSRTTGGSDSSC